MLERNVEVCSVEMQLAKEDFELLKRVLERYVSDLRAEIAGTENADWRKEMHADEDRAKELLARLGEPQPSADNDGEVRIVVRGFVLRG